MPKDEHGMPSHFPGEKLPWFSHAGEDGYVVVDNEGERVLTICDSETDVVKTILHAANYIMLCREIVRRLAENEEMRSDEWVRLIVDAKELWAKMKGGEE